MGNRIYFKSGKDNNFNISYFDIDDKELSAKVLVDELDEETIGSFKVTSRGVFYTAITNGVEEHLYLNDLKGNNTEIALPVTTGDLTLYTRSPKHNELWVLLSGWTINVSFWG